MLKAMLGCCESEQKQENKVMRFLRLFPCSCSCSAQLGHDFTTQKNHENCKSTFFENITCCLDMSSDVNSVNYHTHHLRIAWAKDQFLSRPSWWVLYRM